MDMKSLAFFLGLMGPSQYISMGCSTMGVGWPDKYEHGGYDAVHLGNVISCSVLSDFYTHPA
jgi:hypothetical protein